MKKLMFAAVAAAALLVAGCDHPDDATVAKKNMSKAADNFEIMRRVILHNVILGKDIMVTEGLCSVEPHQLRTSIICKVGPRSYIRNFYGNSDNTLYIVEQMGAVPVNVYHYRRTFKPQAVVPDIDFRGSGQDFVEAVTPDDND